MNYPVEHELHYHEDVADWLEQIWFPCACGGTNISLTSLEFDDAIDWLRNKVPIYHMGLVGCCEKLRCYNCQEMPSVCKNEGECEEYLEWDKGVALYGDPDEV